MRDDIKPMMVCKPIKFNSLAFSRDTEAAYYNAGGLLTFAAADVLREGYDPTTLALIGSIIESEATNEALYSEDFSNSEWSKTAGATITEAPAEINPTGAAGCETLLGVGFMIQQEDDLFPSGAANTLSVYVKSSDPGVFQLSGVGQIAMFNLIAGTITYGSAWATMQALPNGWFRCSVTGNSYVSSKIQGSMPPGGGAEPDILVWGAQHELGSIATSYIPTTSTAETRAADVYGEPPTMISSNIPEDDYPDYDPATTYAAGDKVMVRGSHHRNYQSTGAANIGNFPPENTGGLSPKWIDIGATKRWRMFDSNVGSDLQSEADGPIYVTLAVDTPVTSITLLNIEGVTVYVAITSPTAGLIYEKTVEIVGDPAEATWWDYLFGRRKILKNLTLTGIPENEGVTVQVQVMGLDDEDPTALGKLVIGEGIVLGYTEYGISVGIVDYSTKEPDLFGNYFIQERPFVGKADLKIVVEPGWESFVRDTLADLRATPSVYIGHQDYEATIIYGFYKDFSILFSTPADSFCSMTIEGI